MQYLAQAGEGEVWPDCERDLVGPALKCSSCKSMLHLGCSDLPRYYLVLVGTSRVTYTCRRCVKLKAGENYEDFEKEIAVLLNSTVNNEIKRHLGEASVSDAESSAPPASQSDLLSGSMENVREEVPDASVSDKNALNRVTFGKAEGSTELLKGKRKRNYVCKYYKFGNCKYGVSGKDCSYEHLRKCYGYLKAGSKGCQKGGKCTYFHPPICREAESGRSCSRENCRYFHPKGMKTLRREMKGKRCERDVESVEAPFLRRPRASYAEVTKGGRTGVDFGEGSFGGLTSRDDGYHELEKQRQEQNFRNMQLQVSKMEMQLQKLIEQVSHSETTTGKACNCHVLRRDKPY